MSKIELAMNSLPEISYGSTSANQGLRLRLYILLFAADALSLFLGFTLAEPIRGANWISAGGINLAFMVFPIYAAFAFSNQAFSMRALKSASASCRSALISFLIAIAVIFMVGFSLHAVETVSRIAFTSAVALSAVLLLSDRLVIGYFVQRTYGGALRRELMIIDGGVQMVAQSGCEVLNASDHGIEPDLNDPQMLHRLGTILHNYDRVVVNCPVERQGDWALLLKGANITGEIMLPSLGKLGAVGVGEYGGEHTVVVARGPLALANRAKKRMLDIALTVPFLILLLPLMLLVALSIKLDSRGPIFFRQERIGRGNRIFSILKFRSMHTDQSDAVGQVSARRGDKRVTRVGRFIRATSIDELPQLFNVLLGDMSLVGPRPHALGSLAGDKLFWEIDRQYWHRHALKPGITGLAQVRGFRGATVHHSDLQNRLEADLEYLEGWSLWRDVTILSATIGVVAHKNAF